MTDLRMVPAATFDDARLADLFTRGYDNYWVPVTLDAAAFRTMATLCDVDLDASRVALLDGEPAGIVQLAVRGDRGWIAGIGVVAAARRRGLGRALMDAAIESAHRLDLATIDLEVLVENAPALPLYEACGFVRTRLLRVLARDAGAPPPAPMNPRGTDVVRVELDQVFDEWDALHHVPAPWQRAPETIEHVRDGIAVFGVRAGARLAASAIVRQRPGVTHLIEAGAAEGAHDALLAVLEHVVAAHADQAQLILNIEAADPACAALLALGYAEKHVQHEMRLTM